MINNILPHQYIWVEVRLIYLPLNNDLPVEIDVIVPYDTFCEVITIVSETSISILYIYK